MMEKNAKIYVAGHRGMVGSAIVRELQRQGYTNLVLRTHRELDLTRQADVEAFFRIAWAVILFGIALPILRFFVIIYRKKQFIG